jgi:hypothetical protein
MNDGWKNLAIGNVEKRKKYLEDYDVNPKLCKHCGEIIPYEKRMNNYCNSSCFASSNNVGICRNKDYYDKLRKPKSSHKNRIRIPPVTKPCKLCGKENPSRRDAEGFCNHIHALLYKTKQMIESGTATHSNKHAVRSYLIYINKGKCEQCKNGEWMERVLSLEMHHIDGDVDNMKLTNLKLLCPNCHSITDNYKSKNRNENTNRKLYGKTR